MPPTFLSLPREIKLIIANIIREELPALGSLRGASRVCQAFADEVFYRTLSLHNCNDEDLSYSYKKRWPADPASVNSANTIIERLVLRLQDANDDLVHWVRELAIGPFHEGKLVIEGSTLCRVLSSLTNLKSISWNTGVEPPPEVVAHLQQNQKECRLHVRQLDRYEPRPKNRLLSLPQLSSLTIRVIAGNYTSYEGPSEFPLLTKLLCEADKLENLAMFLPTYGRVDLSDVQQRKGSVGPLCLDFSSQQRLAPLRSLTIDRYYNNQSVYVEKWMHAMCWDHLQYLDTGRVIPTHLIRALTGKVSQLKVLKFFLDDNHDCQADRENFLQVAQMPELVDFIASIKALEEMVCDVRTVAYWEAFWAGLLEHQGRSLRSLTVRYHAAICADDWESERLEQLLAAAPDLEDLTVELKLEAEDTIGSSAYYRWPKSSERVLVQFRKLRRLNIMIPLDWLPNEFSHYHDDVTALFEEKYARKVVSSLFEAFLAENGGLCTLDFLIVRFWRRDRGPVNWCYTLRRVYFPLPGQAPYSIKQLKLGNEYYVEDWFG